MSRYRIEERLEAGERVFVLRDDQAKALAVVVPSVGAQCNRFERESGGRSVPFLVAAESVEQLKGSPMRFGNPILFPFPNRVRGGHFTFDGMDVQLPINEPARNHAIHGLVFDRPWETADVGADDGGAWVRCRFDSAMHPDVAAVYPFPFVISYTYTLRAGALESRIEVQNTGTRRMPFGFGLHAWFPLPLTAGGERADCRLTAPTSQVWELAADFTPTGRILPASADRDLAQGVALGTATFDDVYTGLPTDSSWEAVYSDPRSGWDLAVVCDPSFRELVVYAPADREVVCMEPYTCTTNAFNLAEQGVDAGRRVLRPGEVWTGSVTYAPRPIANEGEAAHGPAR